MRPTLRIAALLLAPVALAPLALLLAACGDCDCESHKQAAKNGLLVGSEEPPPSDVAAIEAARRGGPIVKVTDLRDVQADGSPTPPVVAQAWRGEGTTLELSVWHMRCGGCEKKVEDALKALPGVKDVVATNADSKVVLTLDDAGRREALKPEIEKTLAALDFQLLGK